MNFDMLSFEDIEQKGYCILKNIIEPELISKIKSKVNPEWSLNPNQKLQQLNRSNKFLVVSEVIDILMNSKIDYLCKMFCGTEYRYDHIFFVKSDVKKGKVKTPEDIYDLKDIHGGPFSNGGTNFYLKDAPKNQPFPRTGRLNIGIPLTSSNHKIGGPQILEGTHRDDQINVYGRSDGRGGVSDQWIKDWRSKGNEILIPELNVGDILIFVDACLHGTSKHTEDRMICYAMACPSFVQIVHWEKSAAKYLNIAKTQDEKVRFLKPWWFDVDLETFSQTNRKKKFRDNYDRSA
jgi:hypothetical protein